MKIGDKVIKTKGDYRYQGVIVSRFTKLGGAVRFVVENPDGILHIFSENTFELVRGDKD